jgi:uncharacterized protein YukE
MGGTGEVVQATPEDMVGVAHVCYNWADKSVDVIHAKLFPAVNGIMQEFKGDFAAAFAYDWEIWQKQFDQFPVEIASTGEEMQKYAETYEEMDRQAQQGVKGIRQRVWDAALEDRDLDAPGSTWIAGVRG